MPKYEIWGEDDTGKSSLLGYATGDLPQAGDTMLVRRFVREVDRVWRHHAGQQVMHRVGVGKPTGDAEEPA